MLNCRIVKVLTLSVVIIPRPALCDRSLVETIKDRDAGIHKVLEEVDPKDDMDCLSMGELDIVFRTDNNGAPNVGVMLTDPRGRRIGFDPLTKHAGSSSRRQKDTSTAMICMVQTPAGE